MYRVISPKKIIEVRGHRPRQVIVKNANGVLSEQDIYCYEKGIHRPSDKKMIALLKGLECTWDDISEAVDAVAA